MLSNLFEINAYILFKRDKTEDVGHRFEPVTLLEECSPYIDIERTSEGFRAKIIQWYSHSVCLSGVTFLQPIEFEPPKSELLGLKFPAATRDGVGARYLYMGLGKRRLNIEFDAKYDFFNDEDIGLQTLGVKSVSVDFLTEGKRELDQIHTKLKEQDKLLDKALLATTLTKDFRSFHKLTGLEREEFFEEPVERNPNFDRLFDEE